MSALRVRAPAKINWTLEVLGKRPDGHHEVRTVLQTVALSDRLTLTPRDGISLSLTGEAGSLAQEPIERNLAYRAAARLQELAGGGLGARIELEKRIPVAAGLGGGSSDAAAVLRGLCPLWQLDLSTEQRSSIAAELGSDVPFFLHGGAVLASGRGDVVEPLPDTPPQRLLIAWPPRPPAPDKTARMYAALQRDHYTDGAWSERLAEHLRGGRPVPDRGIFNAFERVLPLVDAALARTLEELPIVGGPHLCGSGPALFYLLAPEQPAEPLRGRLEQLGLRTAETRTLSAPEALAVEGVT